MNRDFKGIWIPKEIWLAKELTLLEKIFLIEIHSLDNSNGCFASNSYFSEFFGLSKGRCTQIIKELERKGFITIELERKGKAISKRVIRVVNNLNTLFNKLNTPIKFSKHPYLENDEDNNTSNNNTDNSNIPAFDEFLQYALSKKPNIDHNALKSKYEAWVENGWKTLTGRKIKNWKATLRNTLQYIAEKKQSFRDTGSTYIPSVT